METLLEQCPEAPVLGLSATHIRYLDNQRDMADELFDGCIASKMTAGRGHRARNFADAEARRAARES